MNGNPYELIWYVLGLPLLGFLVQAFLGGAVIRRLGPRAGRKVMGTLAVLPILAAFGIAVVLTYQLTLLEPAARNQVVTLFDWIRIPSLWIPFELRVDPLSMTMVLIITGIGALIHLYATGYMAEEQDYARFFTYLNLFVAFMLVLVLGNNLAMLFIGWEGVGLCSYLLIGFWYKDLANSKAGNKAFIVNRIGDVGLVIAMFLLVTLIAGQGGSFAFAEGRFLSYDVLLSQAAINLYAANPALSTAIALCLFVGAMGKSAQFPLYLWLPDAMAGPTPVSALIHAATMVTAGVFLLNRMHPVFEAAPIAGAIIAMIGAFTAAFAALIAFGQTDIKKVLAYSTVSQLGMMFIACGAGAYWAGIFHVATHAFFKALLFLGAGAVIHAMAHDQDMRHYGRLLKYLPITGATMILGWLAISGVPPFAGFWSKEMILGAGLGNQYAVAGGQNWGVVSGWIGLGVAAMTAMYMTRLTWLTFFGPTEQWRAIEASAHGHHDHAHSHDHDHAHDLAHDHAHEHEDQHGFFYTDAERALNASTEEPEHHHHLDAHHTPHEVPISMWFPLVVLAVLSVGGGYFLYSGHRLEHWLYPTGLSLLPKEMVEGHPHHLPLLQLSIAAALAGILAGWAVYRKGLPAKEGWDLSKWSLFRRAAADQFGYDRAMVDASVEGGGVLANFTWKGIDVGFIDGIVNLLGGIAGRLGGLLRTVQTGYVRSYALVTLIGVVVLLGYLLLMAQRAGATP